MKKKFYSIAMILVLMIASLVVTACGKHEPEKIEIKTDSIERSVVIGNDHDLSGLVIKVTYTDDEVEEHTKNDDMNITPIDTTTLGEKTLTVEYLGLTATLTIEVVATEGDKYEIMGFEKPQFYTFYENSKQDADPNVETEFNLGDKPYIVGDDNPFKFLPIITGMDEEGNTKEIKAYTSKVTVKENGVELTGTALTNVVSINNTESTFDFTDAAVDADNPRTFEITVQPEEIPEDATYAPISFTVKVVDGWNVHEEKDLSRIDNCANSAADWAAYKSEHGIGNEDINAVILHKDMLITTEHVPSAFFWNEGTYAGSLRDERSIYTRDIDVNDTFKIYGNYFSIKVDPAFPQVKYFEHDSSGFGHSALFSFGGDNINRPDDCSNQGDLYIENLSLFGNGERQAESEGDYYGAFIGIISSAKNTTMENCLTRAFVTHVIALGEIADNLVPGTTCTISNTKMIDSFSTMFFAWASQENNIVNSTLTKAGGSLVMAVHVEPENANYSDQEGNPLSYANLNVKDSKIENYVIGSEAWFNLTGANVIINYLKIIGEMMKNTSTELAQAGIADLTTASGFVNEDGLVNFLTSNLADDNVMNVLDPDTTKRNPIYNTITITETVPGQEDKVLNYQSMQDVLINTLAANQAYSALLALPIFKAGDAYITLDIGTIGKPDDAYMGLPGLDLTKTKLALIVPTFANPFVQLTADYIEEKLSAEEKVVVETLLKQFFGEDVHYANMFFGGSLLGATFGMHHSEISSN